MMEAIERHAGERYDGPVIDASHYNLRRQHACVDPLEIRIPIGPATTANTYCWSGFWGSIF
jgi:hypothetical protein